MKWINASEQLPKATGWYFVKGAYNRYLWFTGNKFELKYRDEIDTNTTTILWLDESTPPLPNTVEEEWISVKDRLPEIVDEISQESSECLIACDNGWITSAFYNKEYDNWRLFAEAYATNVTHWRYLPKPPQS